MNGCTAVQNEYMCTAFCLPYNYNYQKKKKFNLEVVFGFFTGIGPQNQLVFKKVSSDWYRMRFDVYNFRTIFVYFAIN